MGVKDLWSILRPTGECSSVNELRGKTVAVDLAAWVCECSTGTWTRTNEVKNPHLRNLFFRTAFLITHEVNLVFVVEGKPSHLKADVIEKRHLNQLCNKKNNDLSQSRDDVNKVSQTRNHFNDVLEQVRKIHLFAHFFSCHTNVTE